MELKYFCNIVLKIFLGIFKTPKLTEDATSNCRSNGFIAPVSQLLIQIFLQYQNLANNQRFLLKLHQLNIKLHWHCTD